MNQENNYTTNWNANECTPIILPDISFRTYLVTYFFYFGSFGMPSIHSSRNFSLLGEGKREKYHSYFRSLA